MCSADGITFPRDHRTLTPGPFFVPLRVPSWIHHSWRNSSAAHRYKPGRVGPRPTASRNVHTTLAAASPREWAPIRLPKSIRFTRRARRTQRRWVMDPPYIKLQRQPARLRLAKSTTARDISTHAELHPGIPARRHVLPDPCHRAPCTYLRRRIGAGDAPRRLPILPPASLLRTRRHCPPSGSSSYVSATPPISAGTSTTSTTTR
jgi:hypothetical protein